jgi:hypothetical protein
LTKPTGRKAGGGQGTERKQHKTIASNMLVLRSPAPGYCLLPTGFCDSLSPFGNLSLQPEIPAFSEKPENLA